MLGDQLAAFRFPRQLYGPAKAYQCLQIGHRTRKAGACVRLQVQGKMKHSLKCALLSAAAQLLVETPSTNGSGGGAPNRGTSLSGSTGQPSEPSEASEPPTHPDKILVPQGGGQFAVHSPGCR